MEEVYQLCTLNSRTDHHAAHGNFGNPRYIVIIYFHSGIRQYSLQTIVFTLLFLTQRNQQHLARKSRGGVTRTSSTYSSQLATKMARV